MRNPASTEIEILVRELQETEAVLVELSGMIGCTGIIDPTETLADRVRHLGMLMILTQANINQLRGGSGGGGSPADYSDILRKLDEN